MEETDLTLWGMGTVRNLRVHWMLMEMGLDYTFHPVHPRSGETYTDEHDEKPVGKDGIVYCSQGCADRAGRRHETETNQTAD